MTLCTYANYINKKEFNFNPDVKFQAQSWAKPTVKGKLSIL